MSECQHTWLAPSFGSRTLKLFSKFTAPRAKKPNVCINLQANLNILEVMAHLITSEENESYYFLKASILKESFSQAEAMNKFFNISKFSSTKHSRILVTLQRNVIISEPKHGSKASHTLLPVWDINECQISPDKSCIEILTSITD